MLSAGLRLGSIASTALCRNAGTRLDRMYRLFRRPRTMLLALSLNPWRPAEPVSRAANGRRPREARVSAGVAAGRRSMWKSRHPASEGPSEAALFDDPIERLRASVYEGVVRREERSQ